MSSPRPIRLRLSARAVVPIVLLTLLWVIATTLALTGTATKLHWLSHLSTGRREQVEAAVIAGAGILICLITIVVIMRFTRRLTADVTRLASVARRIADGEEPEPESFTSAREISEAVEAITALRDSFADATATETRLRDGLRQILISLGRRNSSLLHRQLRIIDDLEHEAISPQALSDLFTLDHLTTRMRRHAESLTIVAGGTPARAVTEAVPVVDVVRAAAAEVEDYKRVTVITDAEEAIASPAVTDLIHLLAELIENATLFSPSNTRVEVRAAGVANGFAVEVEDRGLGIAPEHLDLLNAQLASPPDLGGADADRLGLFVVGMLAARHGAQVSLCQSAYRGTKAVVVLPDTIVVAAPPAALRQHTASPDDSLLRRVPAAATAGGNGTSAPSNGLPRRARSEPAPESTQARSPSAPEPTQEKAPPPALPTRHSRVADQLTMPPADSTHPAPPAPERARNLAASLQLGWQRSRDDDESEGTP
jgi:signal transduction histidine kinase